MNRGLYGRKGNGNNTDRQWVNDNEQHRFCIV